MSKLSQMDQHGATMTSKGNPKRSKWSQSAPKNDQEKLTKRCSEIVCPRTARGRRRGNEKSISESIKVTKGLILGVFREPKAVKNINAKTGSEHIMRIIKNQNFLMCKKKTYTFIATNIVFEGLAGCVCERKRHQQIIKNDTQIV